MPLPAEFPIFRLLGPDQRPLEKFQGGGRLGQGQPRQADLRQYGHMVRQRLCLAVA